MASRGSAEVRRFREVALQRFEDAEVLLANSRTNGAMYLAGYAIECMLKALLLAHAPASQHPRILKSFRGKMGHDLEGLKRALQRKGITIPAQVVRRLASVNTWSTELRYLPGRRKWQEAKGILVVAEEIIAWAKGRL